MYSIEQTDGTGGEQPAGTGLGAATGGVAVGALAGSIAGPVGAVVGAAIGAVAGGLAGRGIADAIDTAAEEGYWRDNFSSRPYVKGGSEITRSNEPSRNWSANGSGPGAVQNCHGPAPGTPPATRGSTSAMRLNA